MKGLYMEKIYYIGYYDCDLNKEQNRKYILAATNKMTYIAKALAKNDLAVEIVSASGTQNKWGCGGRTLPLENNVTLKLFPSIGAGNKIKRLIQQKLILLQMFFYLLNTLKENDCVIVYHSLSYIRMLRLLHKFKKLRLLLELEELYGDVTGDSNMLRKEKQFAKKADAYILPTAMLKDSLSVGNKPCVLIHGTYQVEPQIGHGFGDNKIHVVYAGTFDPRKGGAAAAAAAAEYLPENYHVHILGFGSKSDTETMQRLIADVSTRAKATVTYDGLLSGEDYIRFIQSCHIGLSTQNPDADFNNTSFPSKILSYMANGLRVVSIRIPAIETSAIGGAMYYYDKQTPEEIARAIMNIDASELIDMRKIIVELDMKFQNDIQKIMR